MTDIGLLYHDVVEPGMEGSSGFPGSVGERYKLEAGEFREGLRLMAASIGARPVGAHELSSAKGGKNLVLTFDDGGSSAMYVSELLDEAGWPGNFFITTDCVGKAGFLGGAEIRDLRSRGHVIGSHSASHPKRMSALSPAEMDSEWTYSVKALSDILGEKVVTASVPGGYYSAAVARSAAGAGVEILFTSEATARRGQVGGCLVLGRYSVTRGMAPSLIADIASGKVFPRCVQSATWNLKKLAKALGGEHYLAFRRRLLGGRD